jgi:hypothetical protein
LLRKLLFFYGCAPEDNVMVAEMSKLMKNSLDAAPDGLKDQIQDKQRRWQLERFVDVSLQARTLLDPSAVQSVLTTVEALAAAAPAMREYLVHGKLADLYSPEVATGMRRRLRSFRARLLSKSCGACCSRRNARYPTRRTTLGPCFAKG